MASHEWMSSLSTGHTAIYVLLSLVAALSAQYLSRRRRTDVYLLPVAPSGDAHWLFGHELAVWRKDASCVYADWVNDVGQLFRMKAALCHDDLVVTADHAAARHILANVDTYIKEPAFGEMLRNITGVGLVGAEGDDHRLQRRVIAPAFSTERVREMTDVVSDSAEKLVESMADALGGEPERIINVSDVLTRCTLDIIDEYRSATSSSRIATSDAKDIMNAWKAINRLQDTFMAFFFTSLIRCFPWITSLPVKALKTQGTAKIVISRLAREMLTQPHIADGKDLLSNLTRDLRAEDSEKNPQRITEGQAIDNVVTFILAGHETSTSTIKFTLHSLSRQPRMQQRLREEIVKHGGALGYDDVQSDRMPYLDAVVKEGLRMHPASPFTARYTTRDDAIPLQRPITGRGGKKITELLVKRGTLLIVPLAAMNVDKSVWGPDADIYNPDRWITPDGLPAIGERPGGWSGMLTFLDGPRNCVGWRLAVLETKIIVAHLVRDFAFGDPGIAMRVRSLPSKMGKVGDEVGVMPLTVSLAKNEN